MLKKTLLAIFLLTVGLQVGAQVTFQAKVSKNRMGINERLKVSFEMNKNGYLKDLVITEPKFYELKK